jgi:hypothetical protein
MMRVDNVSIIRGKHNFRMGADIRRDRANHRRTERMVRKNFSGLS